MNRVRSQESFITDIISIKNAEKRMGFSWKQAKLDAIATEIRRNKTMAINGNNPDFKLKHPDWVRDAQQKNYTQMEKITKEYMQLKQKQAQSRRDKLVGKN